MSIKRNALHQAIDQLSEDRLVKLADFIERLQDTQIQDEHIETKSQLQYSQSAQLHRLREQLTEKYKELVNENQQSLIEELSWLEQISNELQSEFLLELLLATQQSQQSHNWSEVIRVIEYWKALVKDEPPFEPVNFPEGLLKDYDFPPEFIAQTRKELWSGFGGDSE